VYLILTAEHSADLYSELWWLSGGKMGDYQNCSVLYCVLKLYTVISTLRWAVLTVLWIGFCHTGPILLCVDWFVFICVYFVILHICCITVTRWGGPDGIEAWPLEPIFLQCFDAVVWVIWPVKPVPDMTYNVFGGTLNLTDPQPQLTDIIETLLNYFTCE